MCDSKFEGWCILHVMKHSTRAGMFEVYRLLQICPFDSVSGKVCGKSVSGTVYSFFVIAYLQQYVSGMVYIYIYI